METTESTAMLEGNGSVEKLEPVEEEVKDQPKEEMVDVDVAKIERLVIAEVNSIMQSLQKMFVQIMEGARSGDEPETELLNAFFGMISDLSVSSAEMGKVGTIIRLSMQIPEVAEKYRTMKASVEFAKRAEEFWATTEEAAKKMQESQKSPKVSK